MNDENFKAIARSSARQHLSYLEQEDLDIPLYLQGCRNKSWQPHAWVVDAVQAAYRAGLVANPSIAPKINVLSNDIGKPFADEDDSFLVEAAMQRGFDYADQDATVLIVHEADFVGFVNDAMAHRAKAVAASFENQKKIEGENAERSVEKPGGSEISMADHMALLHAVEQQHIELNVSSVRSTIAAVLDAYDEMKESDASVNAGDPYRRKLEVTIDLERQRTVWDRIEMSSDYDPVRNTITYTITRKEQS